MEQEKAPNKNTWMPVMYANYYGIMKEIAAKYGYAIAIHGSMTRDLDLIAVPWVEEPGAVLDMFREFNDAIGMDYQNFDTPYSTIPTLKPHGRIAYTLPTGAGGYVDISVMPTIKKG